MYPLGNALELLQCIACRSGRLDFRPAAPEFVCTGCGAVYQVMNGVPCFVPAELADYSEVGVENRQRFLAAKKLAYAGNGFISRMYNHYHAYAARQRRGHGESRLTIDIGFGMGEHYPFITAKEISAGTFIGIDIDRFKLEHFSAGHPEVPVLQASVDNLPFVAGSADIVQLLATLEHFAEPELSRLLDECLRVLKPGGLLIACYPAEGGWLLRFCRVVMHAFIRARTGFDLDTEKMHYHPSTALQISRAIAAKDGLQRVAGSCYPFGMKNISWALFVNETYRKR